MSVSFNVFDMSLILNLIILLVAFYILAVICDRYFVKSLEVLAEKLKMNSEVAGATLMAVGSSAPELFTSLFAVFKSSESLSLGAGTIVGSALFNILVIIGVSALYMTNKQKLAWQPVIRDMVFYSFAIGLLLLFFWDGKILLWEGITLVLVYVIYVFVVKNWAKWLNYQVPDFDEEFDVDENKEDGFVTKVFSRILDLFIPNPEKNYLISFVISIILIAVTSYFMVESAVLVATILNIPKAIIGLTVLALGTSVPDLISSVIVAKKGKADMAVSNAVGSNVFDIFIGLGLIYVVYFLIINRSATFVPIDTHNLISGVLLLFGTVIALVILLMMQKWKLGRYSGFFLISLYALYLGYNLYNIYS